MKKGLYIAAIVIAAINLAISVFAYLYFLYLNNNVNLSGPMGLDHKLTVINILDPLCLVAAVIFFVCICKRRMALTCVYWFLIAASTMFVYFADPLTTFIAVCFVLIGVLMLLIKLKPKVKYTTMLVLTGLVLAIEVCALISTGTITPLVAAIFPWYPAAPLLPAVSTIFMAALQEE